VFARRPWLARRTMPQAAAFSWEQLAQAMRALLACDLALKGIQGKVTDPALALELLVIQLCTDVAMPIWQTPAGERRLG
jgi:DNA polymerase III delta subunit